ncbi:MULTISPECIES: condensation domain-containing protein [Aphanizomenon]|uniref:Phthiocerol/phthiodiolone dimycocerosyl transferase n=1 Tax=Aphanizomenon flos-aquae FACHB-1249 TaxID=2692889 RepID=A0ABR8ISX1_APHFL|nr:MULTISPECIES: condensation domain-containing protein [Aphanizomenon]MBD2391200.1 alcohol acetyltransferase [Aphanizomenon flos-aquae FACHB-1171]MBD2556539.1 alcohol acetyltransferase [Aphanizomenon flos-aquae FACHB-1290]MBD2632084.1 alcohol acetyltransferase [Aphanizomenon sp. FACHB-1399]MBD2642879.1 alcohol acetyltransferase [Aphanizomenon sp. FACHB-1401]MBD2657855.1 alcohol acetyltransferase [Aphanizomenon flos-aquae FACHB-1265]
MAINRKLGQLEETMEILNQRAKTWNLVTISRIQGNLQETVLRQSLDILQYRHPALNSHIINSKNSYYFQSIDTGKLPLQIVNIGESQEWEAVVNAEMNQLIDSSKYLLRVVLVKILNQRNINYLITTTHHAITDGLSSIKLHSEILTYCQRITEGKSIPVATTLAALPPIEKLLPTWTNSFKGKIGRIYLLLNIAFQKYWNQLKTLRVEKYVPISQRHCEIIHRQLNQESTQQFIQQCRQENTTVQSALCAALMLTVSKQLTKSHEDNIRVSCLSYLDLRRHLQPEISQENMTVLAASLMGFYRITNNICFWELARKVKQTLNKKINQGEIFQMILIAKQLINFSLLFPNQVSATVSISNVGKINIPHSYGQLELEEISFVGSHALYAGMFIVHAATFQEKMTLNFVFSQPSLHRETMEKIVDNCINYIMKFSPNCLIPGVT